MSGSFFDEYMETNSNLDSNPVMALNNELDIEVPDNLDLEHSDFMSSEFFDSILSMEQSSINYLENDDPSSTELYQSPLTDIDNSYGLASDTDITSVSSQSSEHSNTEFIINGSPTSNYSSGYQLVQVTPTESILKQEVPVIDTSDKLILNSNPNGKKLIVTRPTAANKKAVMNTKQVLKVQAMSGNKRSVLLPFNVAKMKNIKIINGKELQAENIKITKILTPKIPTETLMVSSPETTDDYDSTESKCTSQSTQYPMLILSEEEKKLLTKDGIFLPSHYPLTKNEEKELKRIRRKIRNKTSAQDSRKRKKEYVDGLEERVRKDAEEKKILIKKIKELEQHNSHLSAVNNRLQGVLANYNLNGSKLPTIACLIVLVSALLVTLPNMRLVNKTAVNNEKNQNVVVRRSLLSTNQVAKEDSIKEEFMNFNNDGGVEDENNTNEFSIAKYITDYDTSNNKHNSWLDTAEIGKKVKYKMREVANNDIYSSMAFEHNRYDKEIPINIYIEPDIDDTYPEPVAKRVKVEVHHCSESTKKPKADE